MIKRLVGIVVGGIVTFLLLMLFHDGRIISDAFSGFAVAVIVGAAINALWPFIWGRFSAQRVRDNREAAIQHEVQRQVTAERTPPE